MHATAHVSPDEIRKGFSKAMSDMYRDEVPLYGALLELVAQTNAHVLESDRGLAGHLHRTGEIQRLGMERHGAIRLGTAAELATISRLFAVMGMQPVGYYDLTPAGVPVHSTAFRAVHEQSLQASPFRVFTSLLRLELIENPALRSFAETALAKRSIFTPGALALIEQAETDGGLDAEDAEAFIRQALETFRWHHSATVTAEQYRQLSDQHRLIADVVAFKGPHINHLTPRTLDIDQVQAAMPAHGITPKAVIEGPPRRHCPILLRQTSFKALDEPIAFTDAQGRHSARFGEIEQRGGRTGRGTQRGQCGALRAIAGATLPGIPGQPRADARTRPGLLSLFPQRKRPRSPRPARLTAHASGLAQRRARGGGAAGVRGLPAGERSGDLPVEPGRCRAEPLRGPFKQGRVRTGAGPQHD
jgi:uncharacterized glyoxalase superfamily metalloenzyme YdcJ